MSPDTPVSTPGIAGERPHPGGSLSLAGRVVSRVGYGAMQLERLRGDGAAAITLVRRAVDLGVNHFDTAQFYGNGFSNSVLRQALSPADDALIVSKVGAEPNPDGRPPLRLAQRPEELRASVENNLTSLGLDRIPLVNLRRAENNSRVLAEGDQVVDFDDQLATMIALRDEGKIGGIGLSSVTLDRVRHALPAGIVCVQNAYSLVARGDEDLLDLCVSEGIAWVPFFPLGSALPTLPKATNEPAVEDAAQRLGCTPSQVALAWLLRHTPNTLLIPGTADLDHLEANVAAGDIHLDDKTVAVLDSI
ncbi:aldo/keto reductase [Glaciihabitans sp. UYNi722]|uniref:aldo/keto reductase n=1 Tax=Glaciihabitans sp. UYNi722 TaxID=3156344 RepID=UPI003393E776